MAGSFAKLVVSLGANISSFETDMKRATTNQKRRMKEMERQVQQAGRAIAVAFAAVATSTGAVVRSSIKAADEMQKLAQRTGLSTEALSEYKHVADLSGVSFEQFTNGMKRMQRSVSDASVGLSTQVRAFERLGISVDELISLSPDQQFERIAQAMTGLESATLRSATAQEIFGRSGTELLSVMSEGEAGIKAMREEAARLGLTIGADFANQAALFDDNLERMKAGFVGAGNALTAALLPALLDLQAYFMESGNSMEFATTAGEKLGAVLKTLTAAFVIVKNAALAFGRVLLGVFDLLLGIAQTTIAPITGAIESLVQAFAALKAGDFTAAGEAIAKVGQNIGKDFEAAADRIKRAGGFIIETVGSLDEGLDEVNKVFNTTADLTGLATSKFKESATAIDKTTKATEKLAESGKDINEFLDEQIELYEASQKSIAEYERSLRDVLDSIYPLQAEGRRLGEVLALLNTAFERGDISLEQFEDAVRRATDSFTGAAVAAEQAVQGIDTMAIAADEGARIMERIFQDLFTGIIDDASGAWDAILGGFESMIGRMNSDALRGVQKNFQDAFGEDGNGFKDIDWKQAGLAVGQVAASAFADDIVRGLFGVDANEYGKDYVEIGKQIGMVIGSIIGSIIPGIGTALGAIIGAFGGAMHGMLFGKLFGRKFGAILGGETVAQIHGAAPDAQVLETPLANVVGISGQGGFGDLNDPETPGGKIGKAIRDFDTAIFDILKTLDASEEFDKIVGALELWKGAIDGGTNDLEALIVHRMGAITGALGEHVKTFVDAGDGIEEQIERFAVALQVDKLFKELPDALAGRTQAEFLAIVESYATGFTTIGEAMEEVSSAFLQVVGLFEFLKEFAGSNLAADFNAIMESQSLTTAQALANINSKIFDAVNNFDGSIESLQEIAGLVASAREGEIRLLMEIDAIQKGINANLDKLKADILGVGAEDKTGEQLFLDAQKLIGQITDQSSASDIAAIERQFDSILRNIAPEDQLFMQSEILALIETFRGRSNEVLDMRTGEALSSAESMRALVDDFLLTVGDPLDIIAAAVEGGNIPQIMADGLDRIDASVQQIGPQVSAALAQGLSEVSFTIVMESGGLVTQ